MSAPDPEKWKLTQDELDAIECNLDIYGVESRELQDPIYAVARRRAIEELKALAREMCQFCGKGVEFTVHPFEPKTRFHNGEDLGYWECQCPEIHDRIAAIEAEEA